MNLDIDWIIQCLVLAMSSLHLSAYSHQSKQDSSFSGLPNSFSHVSQIPRSSSLQISTFPPQLGQGKYEGVGRTNLFIPGQVLKFELDIFSSPSVYWGADW